eukprot:TRINITY_DN3325_c0_g1_i2.p1 TRINITY_DN3325_c0_g1~~TRINITY_DN3325_c0_g1_i2.p1  ORF type:complete len:533 (+),score=171.09 TRINITY_DN3325_c0_g1_i2:99-1697(+)
MIRRPPRSTLSSSSAASDVYKRQVSTQSTGVRRAMLKLWVLFILAGASASVASNHDIVSLHPGDVPAEKVTDSHGRHGPQRVSPEVQREVERDNQLTLQEHAAHLSKRDKILQAQSNLAAANAEIDQASRPKKQKHSQGDDLRTAIELAGEAALDARTKKAVERLEDEANIHVHHEPTLGSARDEDNVSLDQLQLRAAQAEKASAQAEAEAEDAQVDKLDADQELDQAAARRTDTEKEMEAARAAHRTSLKHAARISKLKHATAAAAHAASIEAEAAAKVVADRSIQSANSQVAELKAAASRASEQRHSMVRTALRAKKTIQEASLRAHRAELKAQTAAVKRESRNSVLLAKQAGEQAVEAAREHARAVLERIQARTQKQAELAERVDRAHMQSQEAIEFAHREARERATAKLQDKPKDTAPLAAPAVDDTPEGSLARLQAKIDDLQHVVSEVDAKPERSTAGGAQEDISPDRLEEQAMKKMHIGIETEVHRVATSSSEQVREEAEAQKAEAHFESLEGNDSSLDTAAAPVV